MIFFKANFTLLKKKNLQMQEKKCDRLKKNKKTLRALNFCI